MFRRAATAVLCIAEALAAASAADDLRAIRSLELDPQRCYRVRDAFLEREDLKLYFTDGHLIFAKPLRERTFAALFLATSPSDVGELLLIPPTPAERQSAARHLGETILNEKFRNAMLFFTDDTEEALLAAIRKASSHRLDPAEGERIAPRWSSVLRNLIDSSAPRILLDLRAERGLAAGFFAAAVRGSARGRFDVVVNPDSPEQVAAGRFAWADNRPYYETWCRFEARSYRSGAKTAAAAPARLQNYRIETRLAADLNMEVNLGADLVLSAPPARALGFDLSDRLEVTAVRIEGAPVEFLQSRQSGAGARRGDGNSLVVVQLPAGLAADRAHRIDFEYRGTVVTDAGSGVYSVGNRDNWYPRAGLGKTTYELAFRYPARLDLVATGTRVEHEVRGGERLARFRSGQPIRMAGFNLGDYAAASREVEGFRIEVRATKTVESRLQPVKRPVMLPRLPAGRRRGAGRSESPILLVPPPPAANPADGIERVADESAAAFAYFLRRFGKPALPVTVVSPAPGDFGQGLPGLVYASTLSYFRRGDRLLQPLPQETQRFYADLLRPHEIAHQWWGSLVHVERDKDIWLMEALATYSSLLWLEERRGAPERNAALAEFRRNLLRKADGETLESAGPIVLGRRLRSPQLPDAYRTIVYEKGAWILHMLRGILGDDAFFGMLRQLCAAHEAGPTTTEAFRALAAGFVPAGHHDPDLRDFFDQWVYGTGIPRLEVEWKQTARGGTHHFRARVRQSGVPAYFPLRVPVEVHTLPGRSLVKTVLAGDGEAEAGFSVALRNPASRVVLDPEAWLLAEVR